MAEEKKFPTPDMLKAREELANMTPEELETTRKQLLKYCGLDTYAMIKVLEKLKEICK